MLLNTFMGVSGVGTGGGVSYFFEERFEGTGYQYSGGWTETGTGTIDEDYTGVVLEGSQSLRLAATAQSPRTRADFPTDQAELWLFFRMRIVAALSANRTIVSMLDASSAQMGGVTLNTGSTLAATTATAAGTATVDTLSIDTNYNVWVHVVKGTGANGQCYVGFSTSGTEVTAGNAFSQKANGANTNDFHAIQLQVTNLAGTNTTGEIIFDQILMSTTATIGNDPA